MTGKSRATTGFESASRDLRVNEKFVLFSSSFLVVRRRRHCRHDRLQQSLPAMRFPATPSLWHHGCHLRHIRRFSCRYSSPCHQRASAITDSTPTTKEPRQSPIRILPRHSQPSSSTTRSEICLCCRHRHLNSPPPSSSTTPPRSAYRGYHAPSVRRPRHKAGTPRTKSKPWLNQPFQYAWSWG